LHREREREIDREIEPREREREIDREIEPGGESDGWRSGYIDSRMETHCSTATNCNTLQRTASHWGSHINGCVEIHWNAATHCNALHHSGLGT